jgi:hypothetical protein
MSFLTRPTVTAFFMFALLSAAAARAQVPVQASSQATAQPPDDDFYALREDAAAGDAQGGERDEHVECEGTRRGLHPTIRKLFGKGHIALGPVADIHSTA